MKRALVMSPLLALACACQPSANQATRNGGAASSTAMQAPLTSAFATATSSATTADIGPATPVEAKGPADPAVHASNAFGFALYQQLDNDEGNFAFSPASISVALAMTYAGAKGETAEQMRSALRGPADPVALHAAWSSVLSSWQAEQKVDIAVANRLFGDDKYTFESAFLELSDKRYGAPLEKVDFAGAPEKQRARINAWVEEQTRKRIQNLVPKNGVTSDTRLALVNALYFKAAWSKPFNERLTKDGDFATAAGTKVQVPMMRRTDSMRYAEDADVQLLELPYEGGRFASLFVLPKQGKSMKQVEAGLDSDQVKRWTDALAMERVDLELPRFKIDPQGSVELKKPLQALGMKLPFEAGKADFTGIANPPNPDDRLNIEKVFHKAFVAMDEKGTEAAAATAVMMGRAGSAAPPEPPKPFHADHPFLFLLRDAKSGLLMFVGRVDDPSQP